jgi:subtilisin-like proprotein convertase family protein
VRGDLGLLFEEFQMKIAAILVVAGLAAAANAGVYTGAGFAIPDANATGASSTIAVAGDTDFPITSVVVSLQGFTHTWIGDVSATLTSPNGTVHTLFARPGRLTSGFGSSSDVDGIYTFADTGADFWAAAAANPVLTPAGTYHTSSLGSAAFTSLDAAFAGQNGNGNWTLTMTDGAGGDVGGIAGWELRIVPTPGALALLGLGGLVAGRRRR